MDSKAARKAKLDQLRKSRQTGRVAYKPSEVKEVFDEVSHEDYKAIVKGRLDEDDFIVDDDGSGYVDNGEDDWDRHSDQHDSDDDGKTKSKAKKKAAKPNPKGDAKKAIPSLFAKQQKTKPSALGAATTSTRVAPANPYRKEVDQEKEDDFMASLLGGLDSNIPSTDLSNRQVGSRKRKSDNSEHEQTVSSFRSSTKANISSDPFSSDSVASSLFPPRIRSKFADSGPSSDDLEDLAAQHVGEYDGGRMKKAKFENSGVENDLAMMDVGDTSFDHGDFGGGSDDVVMTEEVKPESIEPKEEEEDDDIDIKPQASTSKAGALSKPKGPRKLVNSASTKIQKPAPPPAENKPSRPNEVQAESNAKPKGMDWQAATAEINITNSSDPIDVDDDLVSAIRPGRSKAAKAATNAAFSAASHKINAFEEDNSLRMYWLDYLELNGVVHIIGKVWDRDTNRWVSCCVSVEGIERNLYVLPREKVLKDDDDDEEDVPTQDDAYDEFDELRQKYGIKSWRGKFVRRKYAFELPDVPQETEYLKAVYSFSEPALPLDCSGRTFSRIFGTNTSAFELFVLKRKIMGPCWLEIKDAQISDQALSWCKLEVVVKEPKNVNPFSDNDSSAPKEPPPLTVLSLSTRTIVNLKDNRTEIVCATARVWQDMNLDDPTPIEKQPCSVQTVVRPTTVFPAGFETAAKQQKTKITTMKAERILLNNLLATIYRYDPDVIVGHELSSVTLDVILHRLRELKADHWSRMGRFRREKQPKLRQGGNLHLLAGRLICDLASDGSKSMISSTTWSLTEMCGTQLKVQREDIDPEDTESYFDSFAASPNRLMHFVRHCEADSFFQMAIAFKVQVLPLTKQLTNLAGNSWNKTLNGGRAERNEYILLHDFHRLKYICPDKIAAWEKKQQKAKSAAKEDGEEGETSKKTSKRDKFKGGLVFDPKRGLWDKYILVMDFNSLYPSIIQEFNIDFTTVKRVGADEDDDKIPDVPPSELDQGVLPRLIASLVQRRRQVKSLMKDKSATPAKLLQYDIKQMALKLTANSMYGCLGFEGSRFYAKPLAALTTFKGREILTNTKELAESLSLDVIYGDTDSVMINTNVTDRDAAVQIGKEFKKQVNQRYDLLEIDVDAVFQRMLLLQKKKYAALKVEEKGTTTMEIKGLDMKRREYCALSKNVSNFVLKQVFSGENSEAAVEKIHEYLVSLSNDVRAGLIPLDDFIIYKRLGKNPQDYPDAKSQPHVQVALHMKKKGQSVKAGDVIPYVFCLGEDGNTAKTAQADKARHPDDLRRSESKLKIDYEHYLALQVLPPIERLCDPIEGTDRARIAECLGLDSSRFKQQSIAAETEREFSTLDSQISDAERFRDVEPLRLKCRHCGSDGVFGGLLDDPTQIITPEGLRCPNTECRRDFGTASVVVQLELQIRAQISRFYECWLVCDDPSCGHRTRMMSVYGKRCLNAGCRGQMHHEYPDSKLYNQLLFFDTIFDVDKARQKVANTPRLDEVVAVGEQNRATFEEIRRSVSKYLRRNGRRYVNMTGLFSFMRLS